MGANSMGVLDFFLTSVSLVLVESDLEFHFRILGTFSSSLFMFCSPPLHRLGNRSSAGFSPASPPPLPPPPAPALVGPPPRRRPAPPGPSLVRSPLPSAQMKRGARSATTPSSTF